VPSLVTNRPLGMPTDSRAAVRQTLATSGSARHPTA